MQSPPEGGESVSPDGSTIAAHASSRGLAQSPVRPRSGCREEVPLLAISLKGVELYNWQIDAVERWLASATDGDVQGTFSVFTGGGKTVMALACAERIARYEPAVRTVVVVPTVALAIQWKDRILSMTNVRE